MRSPAQIKKFITLTMLLGMTTLTPYDITHDSSQLRQVVATKVIDEIVESPVDLLIKADKFKNKSKPKNKTKKINVIKTAGVVVKVSCYNPRDVKQTGNSKGITSSGHRFELGDNIIAISPDLVKKGFKDNTVVKIQGFDEHFIIKDRMGNQTKNSIDIAISDKDLNKHERKKKAIDFGVKYLTMTKI